MPFSDLPTRRERSAPSLDGNQPEDLERYFSDLQMLLLRHSVSDENQCKKAALRYLTIQTERLWKTADTWTDQSKTYAQFRLEIFKLYPGASGGRIYMIQDLKSVIGHYSQAEIQSRADLGEYNITDGSC